VIYDFDLNKKLSDQSQHWTLVPAQFLPLRSPSKNLWRREAAFYRRDAFPVSEPMTKHCQQPVKITHWPCAFFIHKRRLMRQYTAVQRTGIFSTLLWKSTQLNTSFTRYNRLSIQLSSGLTTVLNEQPLFVQPVVKLGCTTGFTTGCIHDTAGCQTGCQTRLTTGWMFVYTIQPVVKRDWQPVVSCKRGVRHTALALILDVYRHLFVSKNALSTSHVNQ